MGQTKEPMPQASSRHKRRHTARPEPHLCEAEVVEGLEAFVRQELIARFGGHVRLRRVPGEYAGRGAVSFYYTGSLRDLLGLQTVQAVYLVRRFDIPRPRALLGDEHLRALLRDIERVRRLAAPDAYQTLYLSAAGAESTVMTRIKEALARHTGLQATSQEGDLLLRVRHPPERPTQWEVLTRLSPRPLATRPWRVCNLEGALNATVAHAMALLTQPGPRDIFLNIACGSGSLLIERLACAPVRVAMGFDTSLQALACAQANAQASGYATHIALGQGDGRSLPLPAASVDALCADLPFGHLVGSHAENLALYPLILREAARVAREGALFALISHEVRLMASLLEASTAWHTEETLRITLGGLHPRIFLLRRR